MRYLIRSLGIVALLPLAMLAIGAAAQDGPDPSADCAVCHDEVAAQFQTSIHAVTARGGPRCTTCHTDGTRHMEEGGDTSLIAIPKGPDGEQLCLSCHQQIHTMFSARSVHSDTEVYCTTCHRIHGSSTDEGREYLLARAQVELCQSCHPSQAGAFEKPYGHNLELGGLVCASCHNPHGGSGYHSLVVDRSGDGPCVSCHAEKRGPFVFPHVTGIAGDCTSCHQPHGSSNPHALTRPRVDQLCLECHSPIEGITVGSQPPSVHDMLSPRYRNCTVCHVAIHGSNLSPQLLK
jgi:DmsE family decaheme c-type cytochrome